MLVKHYALTCLLIILVKLTTKAKALDDDELNDRPMVDTNNGRLVGEKREHFYAFEGIPFAEPPIGMRRFEPPIPYQNVWVTPRDATKPGK